MKWTEAQETAIKKDGSDLLVSAGAGCGKTAILTNRILRLMLDNKVDIDRFMIATFTNAAASSMKEKIRKLLYEKLSSEKNEDTKKFIFRQISKLESASISTIHSFCIRLIREYYHVIDADPSFRIIEETNAKLMKEEAMDILFDEMYSQKNEAFMNASLSYSFQRDESEFRTILLDIYEFIYNRPNPFGWLEEKTEIFENLSGLDKTNQFKELSRLVNGNITLACDLAKEAYEKACETGVVKSSLNNLSNDESGMKVLLKNTEKDCFYITEHSNKDLGIFLNGLRKDQFSDYSTYLSIYNMREQGKEIIKETRNLLSFSKKDTVETLEKLAPHMGAIRDALIRFDEIFKALKDEQGVLEFSDLEHMALEILSDATAREEILSTYRYVFVDEYQDTNLVQEAIINALQGKDNLFTVGDIKQSIYRFRQADPDIFLKRMDDYDKGKIPGNTIHMNTNFRTNPNIIRGINRIFSRTMTRRVGKIDYGSDEELIAGREEHDINKTEFHLVNGKISDEIEYVALLINDLIGKDIFDSETGKMRKITYSDICILARSANTKLADFKNVFNRYSIPINSEKETGYFKTVEIEMIKSILCVIDNSTDDINLIAAMRSPVFSFSTDELLRVRIEGGDGTFHECVDSFMEKHPDDSLSKKLEGMKAFFDRYQEMSQYTPIPELISDIYRKTSLVEYMRALPFGNIRANNLKGLVQKAADYEAFSDNGLYGFIHFLDYSKERNEDGAGSTQGEDSVKYMSIHKSKGLEFPIVILFQAEKSFNMKDSTKPIVLNKDIGLGATLYDIEGGYSADSFLKTLSVLREKRETVSEEMRLLYVALTRAKEKLFITGCYKPTKNKPDYLALHTEKITPYKVATSNNYMNWIADAILSECKTLENDEEEVRYEDDLFVIRQINDVKALSEKGIKAAPGRKRKTSPADDKTVAEIRDRLGFSYEREIDTRIPRTLGVSSLKNIDLIEVGKNVISYKSRPAFLDRTEKMSATDKGTLVHYILEIIDLERLKKAEDLDDEIDRQIAEFISSGRISQTDTEQVDLRVIHDFYRSETGHNILTSKRVFREKPFILEMDAGKLKDDWKGSRETVLVKGIIDLMYEDEKGDMVIVDYKTSRYRNMKEKQELMKEYSQQLGYYRKAVETLLEKKVSHSFIYFLLYNELTEV